ncbi:MAG: ABC transporter permease [Lachnospiraceae bacterium]|nr:ABC transporter permease [Lachnospiraceae bacterium]
MRKIWKLMQILLAAVLFATAVRYSDSANETGVAVTVILDGEGLTAEEAEAICADEAGQNEPLAICFYGEQETAVSCEENGKNASVALVLAAGNLTLLSESAAHLNWLEASCMIDADTAWTLFGSRQVSGQILQMDGDSYTVCGTIESERNFVIRNAVLADERALTSVLLKNPDGGDSNIVSRAEQFLTRHGLSGKVISFVYLNAFARDLLLLAPLIFFLKGLRKEWRLLSHRQGRDNEQDESLDEMTGETLGKIQQNQFIEVMLCAMSAALLCLLVWMFRTKFEIPSDMIPTTWSDFSFWSSWWQSQKQNFFLILGCAQGVMQISLIWKTFISVFCSMTVSFLAALI